MSNLFTTLSAAAFRAGINPRTRQSRDWFADKVDSLKNINRRQLMREEPIELRNRQLIGSMNMFFYDPKTKDKLPFYDRFPLAIIVGPADKGFYGLNLHYLPQTLRAKFLDGLLDVTNNKKYDDTTKFQLTYNMLQRSATLKYFKPCFKHYLSAQVKSRFARVPATEWEIATFLPTADFEKATEQQVYRQSRKMI